MMDLHTHLDLYPNALQLAHAVNRTNSFTLCMTTSPRAWEATKRVFSQFTHIEVALGLHPEIVAQKYVERDLMMQRLSLTRFVGEIGLDGSPQYSSFRSLQLNIFKRILGESSRLGGRIMSIHSRRATSTVLSLLKTYPFAGIAILHWYSGSIRELYDAINLGCYFSVNVMMAASEKGSKLISLMPRNKVLPESDGPFAVLNDAPLSPMGSNEVAQKLSAIWKIPKEEVLLGFETTLKTILSLS